MPRLRLSGRCWRWRCWPSPARLRPPDQPSAADKLAPPTSAAKPTRPRRQPRPRPPSRRRQRPPVRRQPASSAAHWRLGSGISCRLAGRQPGWQLPARRPPASDCASGWSPTSARWTTRASTSRPGRASSAAQHELGAEVKFIETTDPKDYAKNIDQFAQDNYDVIVTVGFALGQATQEAEAKKYPNIKFIGVDQFQDEAVDNLAGLIFDEDKAGYLAGALAGLAHQVRHHRAGARARRSCRRS